MTQYKPTVTESPTTSVVTQSADDKFTTFATVCVVGIIAALLFAMFLVYMKRT